VIFASLYTLFQTVSTAWQDIEYLLSQTFATVYLAWVLLLTSVFLGLTIFAAALALWAFVKDYQIHMVPEKSTEEKRESSEGND
jgi:hypothetical protein